MTPSDQARCDAYGKLMEEHCTPSNPVYPRHHDYFLAVQYIRDVKPDHARYHVIHAGVPRDLVLAVDALVT